MSGQPSKLMYIFLYKKKRKRGMLLALYSGAVALRTVVCTYSHFLRKTNDMKLAFRFHFFSVFTFTLFVLLHLDICLFCFSFHELPSLAMVVSMFCSTSGTSPPVIPAMQALRGTVLVRQTNQSTNHLQQQQCCFSKHTLVCAHRQPTTRPARVPRANTVSSRGYVFGGSQK